MIFSILIIFFTLIGLAIIHEFGHFLVAKKFGSDVEEFGIGYPPRIVGKKIGNTVYSLNLLPFGAFVRIKGEEGGVSIEDSKSMTNKPIWQRALIILGGVISFWIIGFILFSVIFSVGAPVNISDADEIDGAEVQIVGIALESPAEAAGIKIGDTIQGIQSSDSEIKDVNRVIDVQEFINANLGKEIVFSVKRDGEILGVSLVPRIEAPEGEGAIGVSLTRTAIQKYSLAQSSIEAVKACLNLTHSIVIGFGNALRNAFIGQPTGVEIVGPVGIGSLMSQAMDAGFIYYLQFVALVSIHLAVVNLLPIPAVDGGKLLFLGIEKIKGKPLNRKVEGGINAFFFILLIIMMFFVTIKDVARIF